MEYLLKASAVIVIFYTCYKLFLERETFFESNRWFLLSGLISAIFIPFIVIPIYIEYVPVAQNFIVPNNGITQTAIEKSLDISQILYLIYGAGTVFFLIKLVIEFSSLLLLLKKNKESKKGAFTFIETHKNVSPFSFFKYIVYNKTQFNDTEIDLILNHEKVHAKQYHSLDIILVQLASALFWFNPFIWLYKKELQQNLEFIADKEAQYISKCEKSYQTLLLKSSVPNYQLVLANNFYNSLIKKRIVMLHKSKSNKLNLLKYALVLPLLAIFLMNANTKEIYVEKAVTAKNQTSLADPSVKNEFNNLQNYTDNKESISNTKNETKTADSNNKSLNQENSNTQKAPKIAKVVNDLEMVVITKDFTDADFESLKKELNEKGVTVKFKGIKRNSKNEITAIKIDVSSKTSNANYNTESDNPIKPIKIGFDSQGGSISIGNSANVQSGENAFFFKSKDGNHEVHTVGDTSNVFVIAGDDDENSEKIVVRSVDKVHFSPKATSKVHFISEDGNVTELDDENIVVWESKTGDVDTIHVKKMNKGKAIWINKEDDDKIYEIKDDSDHKFFISTDGEKEPLYILNGKIISKKEMDALKPESIEKVEVLKGDSATEKYGDKGKNGVIMITTKEK